MAKKKDQAPTDENQPQGPLTEQESAPDTASPVDPEVEALRAKAEQAEVEAKALEDALAKSQQLLAEAQKSKEVSYVPPPAAPVLPRNMRVERSGNLSVPMTVRWPQIRGGTCEFCGVLDPNVPAQYQYKLCSHFRGMTARCTYCPENKDPDEVTYHANLNVATHPDNPNTLIMWCNSFSCTDAHFKRWSKATV